MSASRGPPRRASRGARGPASSRRRRGFCRGVGPGALLALGPSWSFLSEAQLATCIIIIIF